MELFGKRSGKPRGTFHDARQSPTLRGLEEGAEYGSAVVLARRPCDGQFVAQRKRLERRSLRSFIAKQPTDFDFAWAYG